MIIKADELAVLNRLLKKIIYLKLEEELDTPIHPADLRIPLNDSNERGQIVVAPADRKTSDFIFKIQFLLLLDVIEVQKNQRIGSL